MQVVGQTYSQNTVPASIRAKQHQLNNRRQYNHTADHFKQMGTHELPLATNQKQSINFSYINNADQIRLTSQVNQMTSSGLSSNPAEIASSRPSTLTATMMPSQEG